MKSFSGEEIEAVFDKKIAAVLDERVTEQVSKLIGEKTKSAGRGHEQRTDLKWALESILSRVERGMTVDVRFLPPAEAPESPESESAVAPFTSLSETVPGLTFPAVEGSPVLQLPPAEPPKKADKKE